MFYYFPYRVRNLWYLTYCLVTFSEIHVPIYVNILCCLLAPFIHSPCHIGAQICSRGHGRPRWLSRWRLGLHPAMQGSSWHEYVVFAPIQFAHTQLLFIIVLKNSWSQYENFPHIHWAADTAFTLKFIKYSYADVCRWKTPNDSKTVPNCTTGARRANRWAINDTDLYFLINTILLVASKLLCAQSSCIPIYSWLQNGLNRNNSADTYWFCLLHNAQCIFIRCDCYPGMWVQERIWRLSWFELLFVWSSILRTNVSW